MWGKNVEISCFPLIFPKNHCFIAAFLSFSCLNRNIYYAVSILWGTCTHPSFGTLLSIWLNCRGKQETALLLWSCLMAPAVGWPCLTHPLLITAFANIANASQWDFLSSAHTHLIGYKVVIIKDGGAHRRKTWIDGNQSSSSLSFRPDQWLSLSPPRNACSVDTTAASVARFPLTESSLHSRGSKAGSLGQRTS